MTGEFSPISMKSTITFASAFIPVIRCRPVTTNRGWPFIAERISELFHILLLSNRISTIPIDVLPQLNDVTLW